MNKISRQNGQKALTLVELLMASGILIIAIAGILMSYIRSMELSEVARNSSLALQAARTQMEQIKSTDFTQIKANFNQDTFTINGLNGMGVSYVDDTIPTFLSITVSMSWQGKNGRIFGEDKNLNGVIDAGEDINGNGTLDSPVELVGFIFDRT